MNMSESGAQRYLHFDPGYLFEVVAGDREVYLQLAHLFLDQSEVKYQRLRKACLGGEWSVAEKECHTLKSMAGQMGAHDLMSLLAGFEMACRERRTPMIDLCNEVDIQLRSACREIRHFVSRIERPGIA
jgi:HPt (histidine-containing phosphotransfer) domain-containing protein